MAGGLEKKISMGGAHSNPSLPVALESRLDVSQKWKEAKDIETLKSFKRYLE